MLAVVRFFQGTSPAMNAMARELALEFAAAAYTPVMVEHIPGAAKMWLHVLSRKFKPDKWALPQSVQVTAECQPRPRPSSWYLALVPPSGSLSAAGTLEPEVSAASKPGPSAGMPHMGGRRGNEPHRSVWVEAEDDDPSRFLASSPMCMRARSFVCSEVRGSASRARLPASLLDLTCLPLAGSNAQAWAWRYRAG